MQKVDFVDAANKNKKKHQDNSESVQEKVNFKSCSLFVSLN